MAKKGISTRRGTINMALNGLVATGAIAGFRTNYQTKDEPDRLAITINARGDADTIRAKVLDALAEAAEGAEIIIEPA
jgi:hypothetical protein